MNDQRMNGSFCRMALTGKSIIALLLMTAHSVLSASAAEFSKLPSLPDREGFAGAFAGVAGDTLIVAGGANFPDKKPWEGGKKVWYDTVFALEETNGAWKVVGKLPRPLGYGVSVTTKAGVVCAGGSDAEKHHAEVFLLSLQHGRLEVTNLPRLPVPLANGAGALVGETLFIFGGSEQPGEQSALKRLFALDLQGRPSPVAGIGRVPRQSAHPAGGRRVRGSVLPGWRRGPGTNERQGGAGVSPRHLELPARLRLETPG